jgi:YggT family protein
MILLSNVLIGLATMLNWILMFYIWILIARAILSWIRVDPRNQLASMILGFIYAVTDPPMRAIRKRLPMSLRYFPLDIAFLVLFALVIFAQYGIVQSLFDYGLVLRRSALSEPSVPSEIY